MPTALNTYGTLNLSSSTLTLMAIVSVCLMAVAGLSYIGSREFNKTTLVYIGVAVHICSFALLVTIIATWYTEIGWSGNNAGVVIGAIICGVVLVIIDVILPVWVSYWLE